MKVRVKANNRYGEAMAGEWLEVGEREYAQARHALESEADIEAGEQAALEAAAAKRLKAEAEFDAARAASMNARKQLAERERQETIAKFGPVFAELLQPLKDQIDALAKHLAEKPAKGK